jgi:hypothetical protein
LTRWRRSGGARFMQWRRSGGVQLMQWRRSSGGGKVRAEEGSGARVRSEVLRMVERKKGKPPIDRLKNLRSAFQRLTGRAPRLTRRAVEASSQSPVRSRSDRTRPLRGDRTQTESGQKSTHEPSLRDRTRRRCPEPNAVVEQRRVRSSVRSEVHENHLHTTGRAGDVRNRTQWSSSIASGPTSGLASSQ